MTDLPPCKLCGDEATRGDTTECGFTAHYTACDNDNCRAFHLFHLVWPTRQEADAFWTTLMSTDADRLEAGRQVMEAAAVRAANACLVPPDGGSPTEDERRVADAAASALRALDLPTILGIKGEKE